MKIKFFARRVHQIYFPFCIKWEWYGGKADKKIHIISLLFLCWVVECRLIPRCSKKRR